MLSLNLKCAFGGFVFLVGETIQGDRVILLIKEDHCLFVIHRPDTSVRQQTIVILDQDAVARNPSRPFVAIPEGWIPRELFHYIGYPSLLPIPLTDNPFSPQFARERKEKQKE